MLHNQYTRLIPILSVFVYITFISCTEKRNYIYDSTVPESKCAKVEIDLSPEYYDYVMSNKTTDIVVLKEDENTMFSEISDIIDANGKYYILDHSQGRTVVSFTHDGEPVTRYGCVGQGPGEYVFPWDIEVCDENVNILDPNSKKIITYSDNGELVSETNISFFADAFKILPNGNINA